MKSFAQDKFRKMRINEQDPAYLKLRLINIKKKKNDMCFLRHQNEGQHLQKAIFK